METDKTQADRSINFKYSKKDRALIAALSSFTFLFIYLLFGPIDIFLNNFDEYIFSLNDFIGILLLLFVPLFIVFFSIIMFFKGTGTNIITSFILSFIVYGYIDAIFINNLEFAGGDVNAESIACRTITIAVFFVLTEFIVISSLLLRKKWKNVVIFTSALFIIMNASGLVADVLTTDAFKDKAQDMYVESQEGSLEVAQKENIIYFLFDRFDTDYYNEVIEDDPTYFDELDGFTYYSNNITRYPRTFPSVPYMITGKEYIGEESPEEYLETCYKESDFLKDLKNNGYNIDIYSAKHYTYTNAKSLLGIVDNIEPVKEIKSQKKDIAKHLIELSLYRNFSYYLSLKMIEDTNHFTVSKLADIECDNDFYKNDDAAYYEKLCKDGLKFSDNEKSYIFIHLEGAHAPYILDENCQKTDNATSLSQTKGAFLIIKKYINELKRLGIYDNSTIIISGDHGIPYSDIRSIYSWYKEGIALHAPTVVMFYKPRSSNDKLNYSNIPLQSENIIPSIIQDANIKTDTNYGYSIKDIEGGADQIRKYYQMIHMNKKRKILFDIYDVYENANEFDNWKYKEKIETDYTWY